MALEGRPLVHPSKHVRPLAGFCLSARPAYWGLCSDCVRSACPSHSKKALTRKIKGERLTTRATESQGEGSPTLAELESRLKVISPDQHDVANSHPHLFELDVGVALQFDLSFELSIWIPRMICLEPGARGPVINVKESEPYELHVSLFFS